MLKTKKAVSSRFRMNKAGKIKRRRSGKSHLLTGRSRARKRRLRKSVLISPRDTQRIKRMLPYG